MYKAFLSLNDHQHTLVDLRTRKTLSSAVNLSFLLTRITMISSKIANLADHSTSTKMMPQLY